MKYGSVGVPEGVLKRFDNFGERVYNLVLRVEPGLHFFPQVSEAVLELVVGLVVEL